MPGVVKYGLSVTTIGESAMLRRIDPVLKQFSACGRFLILISAFTVYATACYCVLTFYGIYNNIAEKILFEALIALWLFSPLAAIRKNPLAVVWCAVSGVFVLVLMTCTLCVALIYHIDAAETCWEVLSTSSRAEIAEFCSDLPIWVKVCLFPCFAVLPAVWLFLLFFVVRGKKDVVPLRWHAIPVNLPFLLCFTPFTVILIVYLFSAEPYRILKKSIALRYGYELIDFREAQGRLGALNELPPPYAEVGFDRNAGDLLGIVVIGESASREHLGCYGYARNTTPFFSKIKDELLLFDNIVSSSGITPDALKYFLTDAELKSKRFHPDASLIPILRHLGADVWYISTQGRWTNYNMPIVLLFRNCNRMFFLRAASVDTRREVRYDDVLYPDFYRIMDLPRTGRPRFIFLHLLGSHRKFEQRVPPGEAAFPEDFSDALTAAQPSRSAAAELNAYDSSIVYTDKFLENILARLKKETGTPAFLLYFSDHGEILNATGENARSYGCRRRELYEVPFVLWTNDKYRELYPRIVENGAANRHKLAQTDRLFPSLCSLMRLTWKDFPTSGDLFAPGFEPMRKIFSATGASTVFKDADGKVVELPKIRE